MQRLAPIVAFALLIFLGLTRPDAVRAARAAQEEPPPPTPASGFTMPPQNSNGLIMPDLGPDATQADYGYEVYRLVCKACHGDVGMGLTPEWIATWEPEDQNCWQLKCHSANHPPEGFVLPHDIPPVVGPVVAARFPDGARLHDYIAATMPWHLPGTLEPEEYWQATAYLLEMNDVEVGAAPLTAENAASFKLTGAVVEAAQGDASISPATQQPPGAAATRQAGLSADLAEEEAARPGWPWGWILVLPLSILGALWVFVTALNQI